MDSETHEIMKFIDKEHMEFLGKGVVGMKVSVQSEKINQIGRLQIEPLL
ncbi:MAG: hypothetical protein MJZ33_07920 [Paludibacteraceae bacterium]|nr:hypothetical protein [Paludibacteraceae bacterium]